MQTWLKKLVQIIQNRNWWYFFFPLSGFTNDGELLPRVVKLADADIRLAASLFDQVTDLFVEPLGRVEAGITLVVAGVESSEFGQCNLHVSS